MTVQVERELMAQEFPGDDAHVIEMGSRPLQVSQFALLQVFAETSHCKLPKAG